MLFGFPFGVPFGDHTALFAFADLLRIGTTDDYLVRWIVDEDCDGFYAVMVGGVKIGQPVYCVAGALKQRVVTLESSDLLVSICPQGQFGDTGVVLQDQIDDFYGDGAHFRNRVTTLITSKPELRVIGTGGAQLTAAASAGLKRGLSVAPVKGRATWGQLDLALSSVGAVHTLTASCNGQVMLTGSRTGNGTITLLGAGARLTFTLTFTGDFSSGVLLLARWPKMFRVYLKSVPFILGDFPRLPAAEVLDDGSSNFFIYVSPTLNATSCYVVVHAVGDDGSESTSIEAGGELVALAPSPDPVTNLRYLSGDGAATDIGWDAPASDPLVTYNYYDSLQSEKISLSEPTGTHAAGVVNTKTLASVGAFTGERYIVVRSVSGGVEEASLNLLTIEYDAGVVLGRRPMAASAGWHFETDGLTLIVPVVVEINTQYEYPDSVELYVYAAGAAIGAATATAPMPANQANLAAVIVESPLRNGSGDLLLNENGDQLYAGGLVATVGAEGVYYFQVGTTANGVVLLTGDVYGPVILTDVPLADPVFEFLGE